jgi:hypothetical protein
MISILMPMLLVYCHIYVDDVDVPTNVSVFLCIFTNLYFQMNTFVNILSDRGKAYASAKNEDLLLRYQLSDGQ